jgi:DNA-binding LacI/PurR family transcriptional regulator
MKAVAAAVGVSTATVSNAYNGTGRVSEAVQARVFAVAEELGYAGPDPAGIALRTGRAGAIGVLFSMPLAYAFADPYCSALLTGVAEVAQRCQSGVWLMPLAPPGAGLGAAGPRESMEVVRRAAVDGVLADGIADDHPALAVLSARNVRVVRSVEAAGGPCVVLDEYAAARAVGEHLAGLGHRRVAVLLDADSADPGSLFRYARLRLDGLRAGLGDHAQLVAAPAGDNSRGSGSAAAGRLLDGDRPPSAIAAVTDVLALGALDALKERELRAGVDVSVTGFDDLPSAGESGLTTVRQPIREKGQLMARMLLEPDFPQRRIELPTQLIIRASTGAARPGLDAEGHRV